MKNWVLPSAAGLRRAAGETAAVATGLGLLAFAVLADHAWLERRFLPDFFQPRSEQQAILDACRLAAAALGLWLILILRRPTGRTAATLSGRRLLIDVLPTLLAALLALGTSELLLRRLPWFANHELPTQREPRRQRDAALGWVYVPDRTAFGEMGGRRVRYDIDAGSRRVADRSRPIDYARPTLLFAGESIMAGHGLAYEETIPAQVEAATGLPAVNLAVGGYATDQVYLRVQSELPQFRRPVAVAVLFMPSLFHRNLDRDRPHVAPGLVWRPAADDWRLVQVLRRLVPYRSEREIDTAVGATREQLSAIARMACARGAIPLIVVPQVGPESAEERALRRRILDEGGLPYVFVPLDPAWRIRGNRHPDARASRRVAAAVAGALSRQGSAACRRIDRSAQGGAT